MIPFSVRLGLDLAEVDRIARAIDRWGETFLERIFNAGELERRRRHPGAFAQHVAGRFAAKEAAMKALGTGFRGLSFREIVVAREPSGKPSIRFRGRARDLADDLGVASAEVTITHTERTAAAAVLLVCAPPNS
ncbi:MAG TPA: holo-ACP synthase [Thermoanaerobaculia bacterium]|nr:holo-ACP synthase [Thermoanaerobaculia bacterium]